MTSIGGNPNNLYLYLYFSKDEEINIFATSLEIAVIFMFTHHVYSFGGENYLQSDSGPIGLRITMAVARLVMGEFGERMREILAEADIKILLEGLFVDDGRDISPETRKKKTSEELCKAMNSIFPNIRFTIEVEEDFESRRPPLLDTELWVEKSDSGCFLKFSFYEKPMKNPFCIMKSSAMSERSKI